MAKSQGVLYPGLNQGPAQALCRLRPGPFAGTPAARRGISKFNQIGEPVNAGSMGREMPRHLAAHRAEMPPLSEES